MQRLNRHGWSSGRSFALLIIGVLAVSVLALPSAAQQNPGGKDFEKRFNRNAGSGAEAGEFGPALFGNFSPITWPVPQAAATPYPSSATYNWCPGTITDLNVSVINFGSTWPDDVDIVLQGPGGQSTKIMSDVGGSTDVEDVSLTFDDEAPAFAPDEGALVNGATYKPTNIEADPSMPAPSPNPAGASLAVFDGTSPAGNWNLFVADDVPAFDGGDMELGFSLEITVTTQPSGSRVCIPHSGIGEPYPSEQTISGRTSPIQDVNVTLNGLSHTWPDDLDVLLVGPGGQNAMLMSDAGGSLDVNNVNLTFDDEAAASLPDNAQIVSGTFKPSNFSTLENLPAPAPATSGVPLTTFDGTNPNGTWRLFIRDQFGGDQGILSGWSLQITTPQATVAVKGGKVKEGKKRSFTITRTANLGLSETVSYKTKNGTAKKGKDYKAVSGTLTFAAGESSKKVRVKTKDDALQEKTEKFFLRATAGGVTSQGAARIKDND